MSMGTYLKISNRNDAEVSKSVFWGDELHYYDGATLRAHLYDNTRVMFKSDVDLTADDILSKFTFTIQESLGEDRRSISFRMSDFRDGSSDYSSEAIYYSKFYLDQETGFYTLPIYIAARCANGNKKLGFNDSTVAIESDELDLFVTYRTNLPPFIEQGIPYKKNPSENDPVFPSDASRVDIGVGYISDYVDNSQGYPNDYLFTNSEPLYEVEASGFMPSSLGDMAFEKVEANLVNSKTTMSVPIEVQKVGTDRRNIEVLISSENGSFKDDIQITRWTESLLSENDKNQKKTVMNKLVITAKIKEDSDEPEVLLTENLEPIMTETGIYLLI